MYVLISKTTGRELGKGSYLACLQALKILTTTYLALYEPGSVDIRKEK